MRRVWVPILLAFIALIVCPYLLKAIAINHFRKEIRGEKSSLAVKALQARTNAAQSTEWLWRVNGRDSTPTLNDRVRSGRLFTLNKDALVRALAQAPKEFSRSSKFSLPLPTPEGLLIDFAIEESPVLDAELAKRFPEIRSYRGRSIRDPKITVRFDWSPLGLHALVLSDSWAVSILPASSDDLTSYISGYDDGAAQNCAVAEANRITSERPVQQQTATATGSTMRNYRIAIAADNEYCVLLGGNTVAGTVASINAFLNGVNAIFERELSVHLNMVNNTNIIYSGDNNVCSGSPCTDANDPYTNGNTLTMLGEVRPDLANKVGMANYDLGHVLGTNSGGQAFLGVVCSNSDFKGGGASGMGPPAGNSGSVGLMAHEIGHQFLANHTFNVSDPFCSPQRNPSTAWETGSGLTIMSYAGSCSSDSNIGSRTLRFHAGSIAEMNNFINGATCNMSQWTDTGNSPPVIDSGPAFTIPKNTPFTLTARGTDADPADRPNLTYIWEQLDAGGVDFFNPPYSDAGDPLTTTRPIFRPFSPLSIPERTFPSLTYVLNNANIPPAIVDGLQTAENLPQVSRTMNFRATVRDGLGGVNNGSVSVIVDGNSGPFTVTSPNGGETWSGSRTITWNVNNTNNGPVGVSNVKITLSLDGGNTFPITLGSSVPNDGSAVVVMPNGIVNTTARVKVEALGNVFFDVSDANFTLVPSDTCPVVSDVLSNAGRVGDTVLLNGLNFTTGGSVSSVKFTNNVSAPFSIISNSQISTTVPAGATSGPLTVSKAGCSDETTPFFINCANPPETMSIDSGSANTVWSIGTSYYVNRLTPSSYPATLNQVSVFFASFGNVPAGTPITIFAAANTGGTSDIVVTDVVKVNTTVGALNQFNNYKIPSIRISAGDFVVGFFMTVASGVFPASTSNNPTTGRSYFSSNGTNFSPFPFNNGVGNFLIRGLVLGGCGAIPTVRSLTVESWRPQNGVSITVSPGDKNGFASDVSKFTRTYDSNTVITLTAPAVAGANTFQKWQRDGIDWSNNLSTTVTMDSDHTMTAVFAPTPVQITIQSNPAGRTISVDGGPEITAPQVVQWIPGSTHTIATSSPQAGATGTRYVFSSWNDGGTISHSVVTPATNTVYTADFTSQHLLTVNSGPGGTALPSSGFFNQGQSVQISATPNAGFAFIGWTGTGNGSFTGVTNPASVTMNGPITETASFSQSAVTITLQTNPTGRTISIDGGAALIAPQIVAWVPGSTHTIATTSPQAGTTGTQFVFANWSDGGAISHTVTVPATNTTFTANFTTQFLLTMTAGAGGSVQPASGFLNSGQNVQISAMPNSGFLFAGWTGTGNGSFTGSSNPTSVTMNGPITQFASFNVVNTLQLSAAAFEVSEGGSQVSVTVTRSNTTSSATVDYVTSDTGSISPCNSGNGNASARCDYLTTLGTLNFAAGETSKMISIPIIDDAYAEGAETFTISLSNPAGSTLGAPSSATLTITDNDVSNGSNPLDSAGFFVRQHYIDFLNREPDASGLAFWTNEITSCGVDAQCIEVKRINVSAAFFLSIEFQETGYLVYRTYKSGFGTLPGTPVPVRFTEFLRDTQRIGQGVVVGQGNWVAQLEANKQAYALAFVQRTDFQAAFPNSLTATQFVDQLNANAGGVLSATERTSLINLLTNPSDLTQRAAVLRSIAEDEGLRAAEFNKAFVLMQYFGYLRRSPNDAPDNDFAGFNFWLGKLDEFHGNFISAELVKAFISSIEYRQRFGP